MISLLKDPLLNYINEGCLYRFLINWVNVDFPSRSKCFRLLYACLHPGYLPRDFLRERATTEPLLTPEFLEPEQYSAIFLDETPAEARNSEDVILCRSRSVSQGDQVSLEFFTSGTEHVILCRSRSVFQGDQVSLEFVTSGTEDVILCRSRSVSQGDQVSLEQSMSSSAGVGVSAKATRSV